MHRSFKFVALAIVAGGLLLVALAVTWPQIAAARLAPGSADPAAIAAAVDGGAGALPAGGPEQAAVVNGYYWSFAAKFVCGLQAPDSNPVPGHGEPVVKPGNYATEINAHNPNYKQVPIRKKVIVLVDPQQGPIGREPNAQQPRVITGTILGPDFAMFDDCNALWALAYPAVPPPVPMPLFVGYLVYLSPLDLDIDAVYTAGTPGPLASTPTSVSIDVNRVTGKRIFIPAGAVP